MPLKQTIVALLVVSVLTGCSLDRWSRVEPGEYVVAAGRGSAQAEARQMIRKLTVDRDNKRLVFTLADGTEFVALFVARERAAWPSGCPANIGSTRMEVLDLVEPPLVVGTLTFRRPVLVRDCPPDPRQLVLREDGLIGGSGTACAETNECVWFELEVAQEEVR